MQEDTLCAGEGAEQGLGFGFQSRSKKKKMNTDITASVKPEYPVIDRNPPFTKTAANFNTLDDLRPSTITAVSVTVGYLSGLGLLSFSLEFVPSFDSLIEALFAGIRPKIRGPSMVTGGLIGVMGLGSCTRIRIRLGGSWVSSRMKPRSPDTRSRWREMVLDR